MANVVLGAAGAVAGFFLSGGNPMGALYGAQLGFSVGSMITGSGSRTVQGPRIGEIASQNSREGVPRPIVWGVGRPIGGNIMAVSAPRIRVVREKVSSGGGGKGGGGGGGDTYQEREEVFRSYAIRICEGPINGVRRVWRNNKLVYDALAEPGSTQAKNNAFFLKTATFHLGGYDQMPSSVLQGIFGVENVPAYRGTCYMTMDDENLTPFRGAVPQFVFEVERGEGFALTSRPYPVENIESFGRNTTVLGGALMLPPLDSVARSFVVLEGDLRNLLIEYDNWPPEEFSRQFTVLGGELVDPNAPIEYAYTESFSRGFDVLSGDLDTILIRYQNWPEESFSRSFTVLGGTLV